MNIIILVACVFCVYLAILYFYMKRKKSGQLAHFKSQHSGAPLDETQKRALAFGGILFSNRFEKILSILPEDDLNKYILGLKNEWEIESSETAKETLIELTNLSKSKDLDQYIESPPAEIQAIQKRIAKELGISLATVENTKSTFAWDTMRAVSLARWCYWAGYLTEQETWAFIHDAAQTARRLGASWEDYTVSFLLGRTIHGYDLDDIGSMAQYILKGKARGSQDTDIYVKYSYK
ncbi:hypothetical protein BLX41_05145 [Pseudomonas protegens]|uniref:DUF1266 domain-containing protein n=1 Tax=Pseudomonas protegens TaxID=380021 RepID=UPI000F4D27B7|nr:DUF1266 domain-containing protein [Pseudomonas protegens]ROL81399.1 hypothetical protein BLX41_05145 [Pseudomonas protegens]